MPNCEVCSMPRPKTRDDWPQYQAAVLDHLRAMSDPTQVREHEYARRRWLGEDESLVEQGVIAQMAWWSTARMLDENVAAAEQARQSRQQAEAV